MKLAKICIMIFVVTAFSLLGADCGGTKSNVFVEVDTTKNKILSKDDYKKVQHFFAPIVGNFFWAINMSDTDVELIAKDSNGGNVGNKIKLAKKTGYVFNSVDAPLIHSIYFNEDGASSDILTITNIIGRQPNELNSTSYYTHLRQKLNGDHLIGVEIMNKY